MLEVSEFSVCVPLQEVETQYGSSEELEGELLQECVACLSEERSFAVATCFPIYIHLLKQWTEVPDNVRVCYWSALVSGVRALCGVLAEKQLHQLSPEEKQATRNKLKMLSYLLVQWVEANENSCVTATASKKSTGPTHWRAGRETSVKLLSTMMSLPLPSLWNPPSPSMLDDLASLIANCVYKLLENSGITREKAVLEKALALLGALVRDYGQGPAFSLKVPQLLRNFEHLVSPLATAVVMVAKEYGVSSVVSGVIREVASNDPKDLSMDVSGTRCFAAFLVEVGGCVPGMVLPVISVLMPHLTGESYSFRNGVLGVLGHLLLYLSKGVESDTPTTTPTSPRDQLLAKLLEHVYDTNAFVRVRVLQTMESLVSSQAIPLHSLQEIVELACGRLADKSSLVRKASLHLLTTILACNPFAAKLELEMFASKLACEESRLAELMVATGPSLEDEPSRELAKQVTVVSYLQNAVKFVEAINKNIPLVVQMLGSKVTTDALGAINFLSKCASFGIPAAFSGVQRSLGLVWSGDGAVRKAVLDVHIQLYLDPGDDEGVGGRAVCVANNLVALVRGSSQGQLSSLERLLKMLVEGDYITAPVIKSLWDTFQGSTADSALAVQVLSMLASASPNIINNNFQLLIKTGLSGNTHSKPDLILAERTCSALSKMAASSLPDGKLLPTDHPLFSRLKELLLTCADDASTSHWAGLTEGVVVCVFRLCGRPLVICEDLLHTLTALALSPDSDTINSLVLSRLLFVVGTVSHRLMLHTETTVTKELRRRAAAVTMDTSKDEEELALAGASGDDPVIELVKRVLSEEVGGVSGLLAVYEPLIVEILVNPTKYNSAELSNSAVLALAKYMLLSPCVCERYLRLFFTVLEKSTVETVRVNAVILASDLACRFPNLIEPWTPHLYARLTDSSTRVRRNTLTVLTHLILNDMVKVRGQISAIALAIEDTDRKIADLAKHFFHELSSKGNTLYNVIPDIVSSLSGGETPAHPDTFNSIIRYIFGLILKDKQCESLVEKLCHRFRAARNERQARDLAHCLGQLSLSERGLRKLADNISSYHHWLTEPSVYNTLTALLHKAKKSTKTEIKGQIDELEKLFKEAHEKGLDVTVETSSPPPVMSGTPPPVMTPCGDDFSRDVLSSARRSELTPRYSGATPRLIDS